MASTTASSGAFIFKPWWRKPQTLCPLQSSHHSGQHPPNPPCSPKPTDNIRTHAWAPPLPQPAPAHPISSTPRPPNSPPRIPPALTPLVSNPVGANPRRSPKACGQGNPQARGSQGGPGEPLYLGSRQGLMGAEAWQQAGLATGPISACNYEETPSLSSIRYHSVSAVRGQHLSSELGGTAGSRAGTAGRCRGISGNNHITQVLTFRLPFSLSLPPSLKSHLLPDCLRSPGWSGGGWQGRSVGGWGVLLVVNL